MKATHQSEDRAQHPLDDLLRAVHVRATVFCQSSMRAPWGFAVKAHGRAAFHVVLGGDCYLEVDGGPGQVHLQKGSVAVLPRGPQHTIRSAPGVAVEWLDDILAKTPPQNGQLHHGGTGPATDLVCGVFSIEDREALPILDALPEVAHAQADEGTDRWLPPLLELVRGEIGSFDPGSDSVVARLMDVLMLQTLRHSLRTAAHGEVFDPQVAAALRLVGDRPEEAWTVDALARAVFLSRSALSERFRKTTGMPPMAYLRRLRLATAARRLHIGNDTMAEIATSVGYGSESALSKAFTREMGQSARAYRQEAQTVVRRSRHAPR
jgi:AraC-like DNA-binding protein/mannose-6-phosphate isomerase-like protein (cupin superfamily)